ncbi:PQQ (pyrrolo quinoline) WD40-like repeat, enzyme repeat domain protein [Legionella moravica]|uniref:Outer membrane protein assembly factor BamB n=1 Tax=Legionella moravica TaxID=39962 RepID=A0A378K0F4_9GAMM|nr:outer membrane protein assembly factor BamB [Legionella moravica]KTD35590.1 PQQ (pyrrolo quinoline) WD40-like repeat, enzyme repeat domain protein [Legionella moravica]STX62739.1 PQQ (pyrrolo quinoline) WD40-like repeat, enzyme repeat domain protein [Legionella moravica]
MKIRILMLLLCGIMQGCSQVDDYLLGKDNTPKPKELEEIQPKIKVSQNWTAPVGKSRKYSEYLKLKPVIRGDLVYTADTSGIVQAVNKKDGQVKWSTQLNHGILSGPTVADGFVVVSTNASTLALLNQADGKEVWQTKVSGEILSPVALSHQKIVAKTIDGKVFAFDAINGKQLWSAEHGSPSLVLKASSSPIIMDNLVLIGFSDGKLDALELDTGRLVWQRSIAYATGASDVERLIDIDSDPIIKDKVAYLGSYQGYIGALSLTDGQFIWRKPGSVFKNMVLSANTLYLTDSHDVVWSLDRSTGHVNWKQTALKARGLTEPVIVGEDIVVGDKTGYLHFLDSQTGELMARSQLSAGVSISPTVAGRNLYVLTDNGLLNQLSVS